MSEVLWTELEKIDILRERMGVNYEVAKQALDQAQGDVVGALVNLEKAFQKEGFAEGWKERSGELWGAVKERLGELNETRVNLKRHDKTLLSVSAPLGLALAYTIWRRPGLRLLGLMGAVGAAMGHYQFEVETFHPEYSKTTQEFYSDVEMGI